MGESNALELAAEALVLVRKPFQQRDLLLRLQLHAWRAPLTLSVPVTGGVPRSARCTPVSLSTKWEVSFSCSSVRYLIIVSLVAVFISTWRLISRFSHTMSVSTAPMSRHCSVSSTPKQNFPVSWLISSKYLRREGEGGVRRRARGSTRVEPRERTWR